MVILELYVKVPFARRDEALTLLAAFLGPIRVQPGLITAGLYSEVDDEAILLLEEWHSREDLARHILSRDFKNVLAVMDIAREQPIIHFHYVSSSEGFELLENLRGAPGIRD